MTDSERDVADFVSRYGVSLTVNSMGEMLPPWADELDTQTKCQKWLITIRSEDVVNTAFEFDLWSHSYPSVLCVMSVLKAGEYIPESFEDFCDNGDYDSDSIKDRDTWERCKAFSARIHSFFRGQMLEDLRELDI